MLTKALLISVLVFGSLAAHAETNDGTTTETCDRLAGDRADPDLPPGIAGIDIFDIDASRAVPACRAALSAVTAKGTDTTTVPQEVVSWFGAGGGVVERRLQFQLARALHGSGAMDEARAWYGKAATAGSSTAVVMQCLIAGLVTKEDRPDPVMVRGCYEKGAAAGHPEAMRYLGFLDEMADDPARDLASARNWYQKAAAAGSSDAMVTLARWHMEGKNLPQDDAAARALLEKAATLGNTSAMVSLGRMLAYASDYGAMRSWYEKAAVAGDTYAMNVLGIIYEAGAGIPRDTAAARTWFEKAAATSKDAATNLVVLDAGATSPFGGIVLTREAAGGEAYGAPGPRKCSSRTISPAGPGGAGRAHAYAICGMEYDVFGELKLVSDVRLVVGPGRAYDPAKDATDYSVVSAAPVYDISGSLIRYACEKRDGKADAKNCRRSDWRNVKGLCLFERSNEWTCSIKYDHTAAYVHNNNSDPPVVRD